jgi:hypothetical protein
MFITALFTTAEIRNQPGCPTTSDWIKKMWHMEYHSAIRKNGIMSLSGKWMDHHVK